MASGNAVHGKRQRCRPAPIRRGMEPDPLPVRQVTNRATPVLMGGVGGMSGASWSGRDLPGGAEPVRQAPAGARRRRRTAGGQAAGVRPAPNLRVLLVEDNTSLRSSLRELLEDEGFDVVGEADDGEQGVRAAGSWLPTWSSWT